MAEVNRAAPDGSTIDDFELFLLGDSVFSRFTELFWGTAARVLAAIDGGRGHHPLQGETAQIPTFPDPLTTAAAEELIKPLFVRSNREPDWDVVVKARKSRAMRPQSPAQRVADWLLDMPLATESPVGGCAWVDIPVACPIN